MGQKGKSMWIYFGLIFFVVVLLLIVSITSRVGMDPLYKTEEKTNTQETMNHTMEQSVSDLTAYNQKLEEENARLEEALDKAQLQNDLQEQMVKENIGFLVDAARLYIGGSREEARQMLENVNVNLLDETYKKLYDTLQETL